MYPFGHVREDWEALWAAVHANVPWTPAELTWSDDVHSRWRDPECVVTQTCGWPLAAEHRDDHLVVGAFTLTVPGAIGHRYRSVILGRQPGRLSDVVRSGGHAVANSPDSLSGWISLLHTAVGAHGTWPGAVTFSGSHMASLGVLARKQADVACIDSWTLELIRAAEPALVDGLHEIGRGPWIPSPAVTARRGTSTARLDALRAAFSSATSDRRLSRVVQRLCIDGFVTLDMDHYVPTVELHHNPRYLF